jgi:NitT/TauT family transport system substrate-binding protein
MVSTKKIALLVTLLSIILAACGGAQVATQAPPAAATEAVAEAPTEAPAKELTKVRLVTQWVTQAQFAGYYAALEKGYYKDEGLDVEIIPGGPDIVSQQVVAAGEAEFGTVNFNTILQAREANADLIAISAIVQRVSVMLVSLKGTGITGPADLKGKKVGAWLGGPEALEFALMRKYGIDPDTDVTIVKQGFDMSQLFNGDVDVAMAQIYNEYAQLFEIKNPDTGMLYTPDDFNAISIAAEGITQIHDSIVTRESFLAKPGNEDVARRFLKASNKGWIYCRDNYTECVDIVLRNGSALGESHQMWMMNEMNALIWPAPNGIGIPSDADINTTIETALTYKLLTKQPEGGYRFDLVKQADDELTAEGLDVYGLDYEKQTVELKEGGQ